MAKCFPWGRGCVEISSLLLPRWASKALTRQRLAAANTHSALGAHTGTAMGLGPSLLLADLSGACVPSTRVLLFSVHRSALTDVCDNGDNARGRKGAVPAGRGTLRGIVRGMEHASPCHAGQA